MSTLIQIIILTSKQSLTQNSIKVSCLLITDLTIDLFVKPITCSEALIFIFSHFICGQQKKIERISNFKKIKGKVNLRIDFEVLDV